MVTPGEQVRDVMLKTAKEIAENSAYAAGNATDTVANTTNFAIRTGFSLEAARGAGKTAFKGFKDFARGDTPCTILCGVSFACELTATTAAICPFPYSKTIWLVSKSISKGAMTYRNLCAGEGC